jgi:hypothetical protein
MDEPAENVASDHRLRSTVGGLGRTSGNRRVHVERAMGPVTVVVSDIGCKDGLEMATPEDMA